MTQADISDLLKSLDRCADRHERPVSIEAPVELIDDMLDMLPAGSLTRRQWHNLRFHGVQVVLNKRLGATRFLIHTERLP